MDLSQEGQMERLGAGREDIFESVRRMAYSQKYQSIYAQMTGVDDRELDFTGARYQALLEEWEYEIHTDVWGRVDFGNVTIVREGEERQ